MGRKKTNQSAQASPPVDGALINTIERKFESMSSVLANLVTRLEDIEKSKEDQMSRPMPSKAMDHDKKRSLKIKRFTGDDQSATGAQWLLHYERMADDYGWSDEWKSDNLLSHLDGVAHRWLCSCAPDRKPWAEMKQLFEKRFVGSKTDAWDKISKMRWEPTTETLQSFYDKMCVLDGIAGFEEEYIIYLLNISVPDEYSGLIRVAKSRTLSDWIENMILIVAKPAKPNKICAATGSKVCGNESQFGIESSLGSESRGQSSHL